MESNVKAASQAQPIAVELVPQPPRISKRGRVNEGRPTSYKPEHCQTVIELGRQGKSRAQMAAALDVAISTTQLWEREHPEFSAALSRAKDLALNWWENAGQQGIESKFFNANLYKLIMSCRFSEIYRDVQRIEHTGKDGGPIEVETSTADDLERELMQRNRLMKQVN